MNGWSHFNLIYFLDFYFTLMFLVGTYRRFNQYQNIGKLAVDPEILNKPGAPTDAHRAEARGRHEHSQRARSVPVQALEQALAT